MANMGFDKDRFKEAMGDMTIIEMADKLGCGKSSISMYLAGQQTPSKMAIQLISLILGVNPAWLCGFDVPKYSNAKIIARENAPTPEDERIKKFVALFTQLNPEQQDMVVAQLEGIVANLK